MTTLHNVFMLT